MLIGGRNILDLATRAVYNLKKVVEFNQDVWDNTILQLKYTGHILEGCIEYVRRKMYFENTKLSVNGNESDDDSETEDVLGDKIQDLPENKSANEKAHVEGTVKVEETDNPPISF